MTRPLTEIVQELQDALRAAEARNDLLQNQIAVAEGTARAAQERAAAAETEAQDVHSKLVRLQDLKNKEYQLLISELFEAPSRRAARLTLGVALTTVLIGLLTTFASSLFSSRDNAATSQLVRDEAVSAIRRVEQDTAGRIDALRTNVFTALNESNTDINDRLDLIASTHPRVQQLVTLLAENRTAFRSYKTVSDVALAYKMRVVGNGTATHYLFYAVAFKQLGVAPSTFGTKGSEFAKWDRDMLTICNKMLSAVEALGKPNEKPTQDVVSFNLYKKPDDATAYGGFSFSNRNTNQEVATTLKNWRDWIQWQLEVNSATH